MSRFIVCAIALASLAACKQEPPAVRAKKALDAKEFWPEAPKPTKTSEARTFRYKPENIAKYTMLVDGGTSPGSTVALSFDMRLDLDFRAGASPREREAHMTNVALSMNAAGTKLVMRLDKDGFMFQEGDEVTKVGRDEPGAIDIAGMTEKPMCAVTFADDNTVKMRTHEDHPFEQLSGGNTLDNALVLFPDLPTGAIKPGHKWSVTRNTEIGTTKAHIDIAYNFEYLGDGACPSGAPSCGLLMFTASAPPADAVTEEGRKVRVGYGFAGKVFFDHDRGAIDESRVRADLDVTVEGMQMPMAATYILKPVR